MLFYFIIFTSLRWGVITWEIWFCFMVPPIDDSTISLLTMINGTLIQDIGERKLLKASAVAL